MRWGNKKYVQNFYCETFGNQTLGRPRKKWESYIKMDCMDSSGLCPVVYVGIKGI
jgi:hypothetical protein